MRSLCAKTALLLICLLFAFGVVHFTIHSLVIYPSFLELEQREAHHDAERLRSALQREFLFLDTTCKDWAFWDDSYDFVHSLSPTYIKSNLTPETLLSNRLNLISYLDPQGEVLWSSSYDWRADHPLSPLNLSYADLAALLPAAQRNRSGGISGLVMTSAGPLQIALRPILPSGGNAPARGLLVMGRLLDDAARAELAAQTLVPLSITPLQPAVPPGVTNLRRLSDSSSPLIEIKDSSTLTASFLFRDIFGSPALLVAADLPRDISYYGHRTSAFALYFFWGASGVLIVLLTLMLRHIILQPMKKLTALTQEIRQRRDFSLRIHMPQNDEVGLLAAAFNDLLDLVNRQTSELEVKNIALHEDAERRRQAEEALLKLDHMKNEFISAAAHELNTPLTAIMGYAELLTYPDTFGGFCEEERQEFLAEITGRGEALEKVISDLLDISHLESGQAIHLDLAAVNPQQLIERLLRCYRLLSPAHHFVAVCDASVPTALLIDEYRITQVLENLLSNAVKYSPQGGTIQLRCICSGENAAIIISDQGIGMNEEQLARVFEKFYRADASNTAVRGLGLGMSIVKRIIEAHSGQIEITSKPEVGTTVTITLPVTT